MGIDFINFSTVLIQASATFTIQVRLGEAGATTWVAYPGDATSAAGEVLVVRGRWPEVQVTAAEGTTVWVVADMIAAAWS